jgi:hypothetical protein
MVWCGVSDGGVFECSVRRIHQYRITSYNNKTANLNQWLGIDLIQSNTPQRNIIKLVLYTATIGLQSMYVPNHSIGFHLLTYR